MRKTILVVEDEENLVELLEFRLKANGFNVSTALDGESGLRVAQTTKPDLIILDLMLPKKHGFEVCSTLKSDAKTKNIPIIILTARTQIHDHKMAKECGADAYITKPFEPTDLMKEIERLI